MTIHTVVPGDTLFSLAERYGTRQELIAEWNSIMPPYPLVVGQALLILLPKETYTVKRGESVYQIAAAKGLDIRTLYANNPSLCGGYVSPKPGQTLVLSFDEEKFPKELLVNAYAYTFIEKKVLSQTLPYLTSLAPFTYGFLPSGELLQLDDGELIASAYDFGVLPLMHLSTLTETGNFSNGLASALLSSPQAQQTLVSDIIETMNEKGYKGLDIDFEFIFAEDGEAYADFIAYAKQRLSPYGYPVFAALAPKTSSDQPGLLYEGHLYPEIGAAADRVFLMTYEWGYTYGPPMAVAPIDSVRRVLDYAVGVIPPEKIIMGVPNYGYDWTLPYKSGDTRAKLISNEEAVHIAYKNGAVIKYDEKSQSPHFNYYSEGREHEVWFEDARSIEKKLALTSEYSLYGIGYWNAMRPFVQNWMLLSRKYGIRFSF